MPTVANYPDGIGTAGPTIGRLIDQPIDYEVETFKFEDGGADLNVQPCGVRRWQLEYDGLSAVEVTTLRDHFNLAKGKVNDFSFFHRHDNATYTGVQYAEFKVGRHAKTWANAINITLVKFM